MAEHFQRCSRSVAEAATAPTVTATTPALLRDTSFPKNKKAGALRRLFLRE